MKCIEKFYKSNKILMIFLLLSILAIVKFSDAPVFTWLPIIVTSILIKPNEGTIQFEVFKFGENMSLAYISGLIFYILIEYLPSQRKAEKSYEIIENDLKNLYLQMSNVVSTMFFFEKIDKDVSQVTEMDCTKISTTEYNQDVHYLNSTAFINREKKAPTNYTFTFKEDMPQYSKAIFRYINNIKTSAAIGNIEFDIVELISAIEVCRFIDQLAWFQNVGNYGYGEFHQFGANFYEFIDLYRRLENIPFDKHTYKIRALSEEEIVSLLEIRRQFSTNELFIDSRTFKKIIRGQVVD